MVGDYFLGNRTAIEAIALGRTSILTGLLLTISAGLARTYDTADLLHAPWLALRGIPVAIANSLVLFAVVYAAANRKTAPLPRFWPMYRAFLGALLWTAPLAWLYAIPYERFLSPVDAILANLWTLALVAAWRVVLISRALSVLMGRRYLPVLLWTLLWSDVVVFVVTVSSDVPVADLMGGLQHSPEEQRLLSSALLTGMVALAAAPVLLISALIALAYMHPVGQRIEPAFRPSPHRSWVLPIALFAGGLAILPVGQGEQSRRHRVERMLAAGQVARALAEMSAHRRADYPPVWDPPPRLGYRSPTPAMEDVLDGLIATPPARWVRDLYAAKVRRWLTQYLVEHYRTPLWTAIAERIAKSQETASFSPGMARAAAYLLEHDRTLTDGEREALTIIFLSKPPLEEDQVP